MAKSPNGSSSNCLRRLLCSQARNALTRTTSVHASPGLRQVVPHDAASDTARRSSQIEGYVAGGKWLWFDCRSQVVPPHFSLIVRVCWALWRQKAIRTRPRQARTKALRRWGCGLGVRAMQRGLLELSIVERPTRGRRQLSFVEH